MQHGTLSRQSGFAYEKKEKWRRREGLIAHPNISPDNLFLLGTK